MGGPLTCVPKPRPDSRTVALCGRRRSLTSRLSAPAGPAKQPCQLSNHTLHSENGERVLSLSLPLSSPKAGFLVLPHICHTRTLASFLSSSLDEEPSIPAIVPSSHL